MIELSPLSSKKTPDPETKLSECLSNTSNWREQRKKWRCLKETLSGSTMFHQINHKRWINEEVEDQARQRTRKYAQSPQCDEAIRVTEVRRVRQLRSWPECASACGVNGKVGAERRDEEWIRAGGWFCFMTHHICIFLQRKTNPLLVPQHAALLSDQINLVINSQSAEGLHAACSLTSHGFNSRWLPGPQLTHSLEWRITLSYYHRILPQSLPPPDLFPSTIPLFLACSI